MSIDLDKQLVKYYETIKNPLYTIDNWIIANNDLYSRVYNKITINNIISVNQGFSNELIIVFDTKKEYYVLKYNHNYICLRISLTEYGLVTGEYELLAIDQKAVYNLTTNKEIPRFKHICKLFKWKVTKRANEDLDYFRNI